MNMTIMTSLGTIAEIVFVDIGRTWQLLTAYWVFTLPKHNLGIESDLRNGKSFKSERLLK